MSKQKSAEQCKVFLQFMEEHPDIAKGFSKGDRVKQDELWGDLTSRLNANGPPTRDVAMWKKTWCDWRRSIKTRLAENKASIKKTGGGDFQQYYLSPIEEQLAIICDIFQAVEGVKMAKTFGEKIKKICTENEKATVSVTTVPTERQPTPPPQPPLPETRDVSPQRKRCLTGDIQNVMEEEKKNFKCIAAKIDDVNESVKNQVRYLKNLSKSIDELKSIKKKELDESKNHHLKMEKIALERNQMKLEFLKLEKMKLGILED